MEAGGMHMKDDSEEKAGKDDRSTAEEMSEAEIDTNLEETFPASDPPSWTLGSNHRQHHSTQEPDGEEEA
jgi:hypothetical protein